MNSNEVKTDVIRSRSTRLARTSYEAIFVTFASIMLLILVTAVVESYSSFGFYETLKQSQDVDRAVNPVFNRLVPTVNVSVVGSDERIINTPVVTVETVLADIGIYLDDNDKIDTPLETLVTDGMRVAVSKLDVMDITNTRVNPYKTIENKIQTIPRGESETVQTGDNGVVVRNLRQTYNNGVLENEELISETIEKPVTDEIINIGTGGVYTDVNGERFSYSYYVDVEATAYSGEQFGGHTFTGKQVEVGMIAVDPDVIPLGSKCYVIGDGGDFGVMEAEDTGSKIIGKTIDIFMELDEQAINFGRKYMRVYVLD